uniref:Growth hormone n=1 Tax=Xiphophorus couchianus TaxID=32473 RepID=A0A3B5MJB5_9TELE
MDRAILLLSVMCLGISSQPITDSQRLFSIAVSRVQHLHLLAQRFFSEFESSLQTEEQRQLNKIFLQDFCNSDYIISPIDKHETQRSSVSTHRPLWWWWSSFSLVGSFLDPYLMLSGSGVPEDHNMCNLKTDCCKNLLQTRQQNPDLTQTQDILCLLIPTCNTKTFFK